LGLRIVFLCFVGPVIFWAMMMVASIPILGFRAFFEPGSEPLAIRVFQVIWTVVSVFAAGAATRWAWQRLWQSRARDAFRLWNALSVLAAVAIPLAGYYAVLAGVAAVMMFTQGHTMYGAAFAVGAGALVFIVRALFHGSRRAYLKSLERNATPAARQ